MYVPEDRLRLFWVAQMRSIQCFSIKLGHVSPSYCLGRYIVVCNRKRTEKTSWFSSCHITLYLSRGVVNVTLSNLWIDSVCGMTCVATSWAFTGASDYMWLDEAQLSLNCKMYILDTFVVPRRWLENTLTFCSPHKLPQWLKLLQAITSRSCIVLVVEFR